MRKGDLPRRIILPLMETHIEQSPKPSWCLLPSAHALATLRSKAAFADYVEQHGLAALTPRHYRRDEVGAFPLVLKRSDLNAGQSIVVVNSAAELAVHLTMSDWAGRPIVLQERVPGSTEYVTHCVCVNGRIIWHRSYAYLGRAETIRRGGGGPIAPHKATAADLMAFERFLLPLRYSGPANFDYKQRADGSLAVFEINPRLGGSLMRPANVSDLAEALDAITSNARWATD